MVKYEIKKFRNWNMKYKKYEMAINPFILSKYKNYLNKLYNSLKIKFHN